jgi:hypothetical protein
MPGIRYIPEVVWHSKVFWISVAVMSLAIFLYHNYASRKMSIRKLVGLFNGKSNRPKIAYSSDGRSGHVHYQSAETSFAFYYEFGGGNCVATISIPGPATWEMETKLPLAHREEVLNFIGQQVVKDQTSSGTGYFKIEGDWLNIYTMILLILMI